VDFSVEHSFDCDPKALADALLDIDFQRSLSDIEPLSARELLEQSEQPDGRVLRRVRCVLDIDIPGAARAIIGDGDPSWIEEAIWDPQTMRWTWTVHPEVAQDKLDAAGTIDVNDVAEGARRSVAGRVKVKVPLFGGRVESWIADGMRRAYDEEATRLAAHLGVSAL
jgi:Protein of unknown function (DUF2505)